VHPVFYESLKKVHCHCFQYESKRGELFANFKLSHRGSIRKPPNVFTWVHSLEILMHEHGDHDVNTILRVWNSETSSGNQIHGAKGAALRLILTMPQESRTELTHYIGAVSWDKCPWTEEALASKKLYPGSGAKIAAGNKAWQDRLKVSPASLLLMVRHIHANHSNIHANHSSCRSGKKTRTEVEEVAAMAAAVQNLKTEIQQAMPVPDEVIEELWLSKFASADPKVTTEVRTQGLL
jgi:hypothetical protein